ncbi:MAG: peptide chain release factor N(5)-glutamine methyltransferase [Synechococcales bacterium]|nr:peptide chain release factor N(5)-glutamine methyltransferase [Synechococcales bacterium]
MDEQVSGAELWQWYTQARVEAIAAQVPVGELDWFLESVTELDRLSLRLETYKTMPSVGITIPWFRLQSVWQTRRVDRVPLQYLVGKTTWRQFELKVSPAVLIPRPETECLIEHLQEFLLQTDRSTVQHQALQTGHWVDLGTGSGAIAIGLAVLLPQAQIHAVDLSAEALAIAQDNAQACGFGDRIQFHQGSWLDPLAGQPLIGIISNPPYIPTAMVLELEPEVRQHEPHLALDGGMDGLNCLRHLVEIAPAALVSGGVWMVEMMKGQADSVVQLLTSQGQYQEIRLARDLEGVERFAIATRC